MVDFSVLLGRATSVDEINQTFIEASESEELEGILGVSNAELVSSDFIGSTYSSIVDLPLTIAMGDDFFKVVSWYDNEWGYSVRVADLTAYIADHFE
jgi:glyceraldehyde 3-phosphate dehydrogenase